MKKLMVSENKRYLQYEDGTPFFYLGDTAWELFHALSKGEIDYYLGVRAEQGFNAIQSVALAEMGGLVKPNAYGRLPLIDFDPCKPDLEGDDNYWTVVDYTVKKAAEYGIYIVMLPTWGDKFNKVWGMGPEIFNPDNAYTYGKWIGDRYKDDWNIIWMLGGDRILATETHKNIIRQMARGIKESDEGSHLITFHPHGWGSSVDGLYGEDFIDFHTIQSGHDQGTYMSYKLLRRTAERELKPFMDSEPRYEDHPACFNASFKYYWDNDDIRMNAYWDVLEGACGHTYGNHCIWSMNRTKTDYYPYLWTEVLRHPGAETIKYVKQLRESRPYKEFRRCPELVIQDESDLTGYQAAGRGEDYAFIYSPLGLPVNVNFAAMGCKVLKASWYNPRTGEVKVNTVLPGHDHGTLVPPTSGKGNDWVIILDVLSR